MEKRELYFKTWRELSKNKSMVFLAGPRQAGKTTLAELISADFSNALYFNWDIAEHRKKLLANPAFFTEIERKDASRPFIIFDEIHKYKQWKNYLKGIYDQFHKTYAFLVSGSGRLDIYKRGGDSLAGRYFLFHLWPFTLAELGKCNIPFQDFIQSPLDLPTEETQSLRDIWERLGRVSGFPEPYLAEQPETYRRWSAAYHSQLIREDIRDLTGIKSVHDIESLYLLLPSKVGSSLSVTSLSQDLHVAFNTVQSWLETFERFFLTFSIAPWKAQIARSIQKERKLYLWDSPLIEDRAARFENQVAIELYRAVTNWNDLGYGRFGLHFLKNRNQQEVDFLLVDGRKPFLLVEAKLSDPQPGPALKKFQNLLQVPAVQLVEGDSGFRLLDSQGLPILVAPACQWLAQMP